MALTPIHTDPKRPPFMEEPTLAIPMAGGALGGQGGSTFKSGRHGGGGHHSPAEPPTHAVPWRGVPIASAANADRERSMAGRGPVIGITSDITHPAAKPESLRATCPLTYARAVAAAGGVPFLLPPIVALIPEQLRVCAGFVFTGGDDPRTEAFGVPTHPATTPVHAARQEYETSLLRALADRRETPVLGVCLGMQMMALIAGGRLNQHLPEILGTASDHADDRRHRIVTDATFVRFSPQCLTLAAPLMVTSHHHQAVDEPGTLSVVAVAHDGVIEGIADPERRFYLGVQWHPERTDDAALGVDLFGSLVRVAADPSAAR